MILFKILGKRVLLIVLMVFVCLGCSSVRKHVSEIEKVAEEDHFLMGFMLYDPDKEKILSNVNHDKYLNPASNTKIATLFTALKLLGDSVPALKWTQTQDTLFIKGTGDPSLLHPHLKSERVIAFLKRSTAPTIVVDTGLYTEDTYGPGWAWEDYAYYFMPERGSLPLYGNVITVAISQDSLKINPVTFEKNIIQEPKAYPRDRSHNIFYVPNSGATADTLEIPFITGDSLSFALLQELVGKKVISGTFPVSAGKVNTLYSVRTDEIYRPMMEKSDNFLAEQLMILSSALTGDTLSVKKSIDYALSELLPGLPQYPRWVDGSGLSRYNLFSPHDFVYILQKMYTDYELNYLFTLFPKVVLTEEAAFDEIPFIYAKPGSFSNNYCLSGFLVTRKGKTLIFSFMANHFTIPTRQVKKELYTMLKAIAENY